jgi:hypothetical protein
MSSVKRLREWMALLLATTCGVLTLATSTARADFGFQSFSVDVTNQDASPSSQAGAHPFAQTMSFMLNDDGNGGMPATLAPKNVAIDLPVGLVGDPTAATTCTIARLQYGSGCPTDSQVGVAQIFLNDGAGPYTFGQVPIYNMLPADGAPAEFAFVVLAKPLVQPTTIKIRSEGDFGLTAAISNISEFVPVAGATVTLWGVPADPGHDAQRYLPSMGGGFGTPGDANGNPLPNGGPELAFLSNPTACGSSPVDAKITGEPWSSPGRLVVQTAPMYVSGISGCDKLGFSPSVRVVPDTPQADSPSGYAIDIAVAQTGSPGGP